MSGRNWAINAHFEMRALAVLHNVVINSIAGQAEKCDSTETVD